MVEIDGVPSTTYRPSKTFCFGLLCHAGVYCSTQTLAKQQTEGGFAHGQLCVDTHEY